ncbi:MAG TPA: ABC transporter substrate-binding protein [Glaciihabitans sp.]|nr:ABC transporter substrate-binding protein [Glaciihabitans sp.]
MTLRFAARHWDHLLPLALGDIDTLGVDIDLDRRDITPNLWASPDLDIAESSFSQYLLKRAAGDDSVTALPVFVMSGFRQRCIITRTDSDITSLDQLRGATVGLTGWPDSGNTWTRALLRREGVGLDEVTWRVGPLTDAHPVTDRIGPFGAPSNVAHTDNDGTLTAQLLDGTLDAVMTPFMPPGFYAPNSPYRPLFRNTAAVEADYYREVGYVPGIHLVGVKTALLDADPTLAQKLVNILEASKRLAAERHTKLQDVLPWLNDAVQETEAVFGDDWLRYGSSAATNMFDDFAAEHLAQGSLDRHVQYSDVFPVAVEPQH